MEKEKIYILREEFVCDFDRLTDELYVFRTRDEAQLKMWQLANKFKKENNLPVVEEDEISVSFYDEGYYGDCHYDLYIIEKEIEFIKED